MQRAVNPALCPTGLWTTTTLLWLWFKSHKHCVDWSWGIYWFVRVYNSYRNWLWRNSTPSEDDDSDLLVSTHIPLPFHSWKRECSSIEEIKVKRRITHTKQITKARYSLMGIVTKILASKPCRKEALTIKVSALKTSNFAWLAIVSAYTIRISNRSLNRSSSSASFLKAVTLA